MQLFIEDEPVETSRNKVAFPVPEDPNQWGDVVMDNLSKEAPYALQYVPEVQFIKQDPDAGVGLGVITVSSGSQSALTTSAPTGTVGKRAVIPFIIKGGELYPLDLVITQSRKIFPLTETRLREALFRPETFELVSRDPGDNGLNSVFGLDLIQGFGSRSIQDVGAFGNGMGGAKFASAKFALLQKVASLGISAEDLSALASDIASDASVNRKLASNDAFRGAVRTLSMAEGRAKTASARGLAYAPDVVQLGKLGNGRYWIKAASRENYDVPEITIISRRDLVKIAGEDMAVKVDTEGTVTQAERVEDPTAMSVDTSSWKRIDSTGIYRVMTIDGRELTGWVFTNLTDFDGIRVPTTVFTNGSESAIQDSIAGVAVSPALDLPSTEPKGTGLFYVVSGGKIDATIPVLVESAEVSETGKKYRVLTLLGERKIVRLVHGVKSLTVVSEDEIVMPGVTQFLPLVREAIVALVENASDVVKTASYLSVPVFSIYGDGTYFSHRSHGVPNAASTLNQKLSYDEAAFALCALGCSAGEAHKILKKASYGRAVDVRGVKDVKLASHNEALQRDLDARWARKVASLRVDLLKEAAGIPDAATVDAALGLRFINPDNVRIYVAEIPYLERCLNRVCEMLLASRLGMAEIPEYAASRAARAMDEVVRGLKALALRGTGTVA